MWYLLLALGHAVAWGLYYQHPAFWARFDQKTIREDGAANSLHDKFHRQRGTWRLAFIVLVALVGSSPAWGHWNVALNSYLSLLVVGAVLFGIRFNPLLSLARGLPEWYVSFAEDAASFPDGYLATKARARFPEGSLVKQQLYAGRLLEQYSEAGEIGVCIAYLVAVGLMLWLG